MKKAASAMEKSKGGPKEGDSPAQLIDARIAALSDWRRETLARVRTLIKEADPEVIEQVKWRKPSNAMLGVPVWEHAGIICTGETYKDKVKLTFAKGASLKDPSGLFNASLEGNVRRAIDFHQGDEIDAKAFKALSPQWRSIAPHEGLAEEAFEQSFGLLACRTSSSAAPTASLRSASIKMSGLCGVGVRRARGLPELCRSPGECGLGRCHQEQGADPSEQDHARRDYAHESHLPRPSTANWKIIADRRLTGFHAGPEA